MYLYIIICSFVMFLSIHDSTLINITRTVCLETTFRLMNHSNRCSLNAIDVRKILQDGSVELNGSCGYTEQCSDPFTVCSKGKCKCINGYSVFNTRRCLQGNLTIGASCGTKLQCTGTPLANLCHYGLCTCQEGYIPINGNCHRGNVTVSQPCIHNWQCTGTEYSNLCEKQLCRCRPEYIKNGSYCYPGHVPVGGLCILDTQCTGSNNSETCENGRCRCSHGYLLIDLECKKVRPKSHACLDRKQLDYEIGSLFGILFGGILLGVFLTAGIAFLIFKHLSENKKREEPAVMFANETLYSSAKVVERDANQVSQAKNKKRKIFNVSSYPCSEKGAVYSFVTSKPRTEQPTEGVYNHLHEQEKHDRDDENYDHACAASYLGRKPSIYSSMP